MSERLPGICKACGNTRSMLTDKPKGVRGVCARCAEAERDALTEKLEKAEEENERLRGELRLSQPDYVRAIERAEKAEAELRKERQTSKAMLTELEADRDEVGDALTKIAAALGLCWEASSATEIGESILYAVHEEDDEILSLKRRVAELEAQADEWRRVDGHDLDVARRDGWMDCEEAAGLDLSHLRPWNTTTNNDLPAKEDPQS